MGKDGWFAPDSPLWFFLLPLMVVAGGLILSALGVWIFS